MNILHLVAGDLSRGAAKGLICFIRRSADWFNSIILNTGRVSSGDYSVKVPAAHSNRVRIKYALSSNIGNLPLYFYPQRKPWIFNTGLTGINFTRFPEYNDADIIHLHWINGLASIPMLSS